MGETKQSENMGEQYLLSWHGNETHIVHARPDGVRITIASGGGPPSGAGSIGELVYRANRGIKYDRPQYLGAELSAETAIDHFRSLPDHERSKFWALMFGSSANIEMVSKSLESAIDRSGAVQDYVDASKLASAGRDAEMMAVPDELKTEHLAKRVEELKEGNQRLMQVAEEKAAEAAELKERLTDSENLIEAAAERVDNAERERDRHHTTITELRESIARRDDTIDTKNRKIDELYTELAEVRAARDEARRALEDRLNEIRTLNERLARQTEENRRQSTLMVGTEGENQRLSRELAELRKQWADKKRMGAMLNIIGDLANDWGEDSEVMATASLKLAALAGYFDESDLAEVREIFDRYGIKVPDWMVK